MELWQRMRASIPRRYLLVVMFVLATLIYTLSYRYLNLFVAMGFSFAGSAVLGLWLNHRLNLGKCCDIFFAAFMAVFLGFVIGVIWGQLAGIFVSFIIFGFAGMTLLARP